MKKIAFVLMLVGSLLASGINWPHDYKEALKKAKKEDKIVYVLLTSDSCRWCRKFENTTLQNKQIQKRLQKDFIAIHISRDRHFVPKIFETTPVPRHYFVDGNGNILYESLGHRGVTCFNNFMDNAEEKLEFNQQ
ncbi:MAG: DUF255 domain-containing protein [Epsilonproteobacteria bacterium]|nr:DUF255 domain-containing protein [Campylobacterota bacterium]